ncbi:spermidine/putrescine ABC transporter substrate-binding protein [Thermoleophilia bacterium SCSIO 60948]|nr:spermidine/putrescine ABC transporter substrate-binding protein [Thermoleophilia bacterium SCSIO 60948]
MSAGHGAGDAPRQPRFVPDRGMTRRSLLRSGAAAGLGVYAAGLSGCLLQRPVERVNAGVVAEPKIDGDLRIFNWAQYMNPALKKGFSEKYGVEISEVNFDNLEAMVTKLRGGGAYDLIFPTPEYLDRLRQEGLLTRFDAYKLKGADEITAFYDNVWWDPEHEYSIPYTYYTTGIAWRSDQVSGMEGSWNDLTNPEGAGKMFILDDFQEAIGEGNLINGFDLNTIDPNELEISKETLLEQKEFARGFSTNSTSNLVSGAAWIHQAWNGDIVNVRNQVDAPENYLYETCSEGVPVGTDCYAVPITAESPGTALKFIEWMLQPENAAANVGWNGYPQPVAGGREKFAELVKDEPAIDVDLDALGDGGMEYRLGTAEDRRLWTDTWTEIKAS